MGFNGWRKTEASEKSQAFDEGQEVSFVYNQQMCHGKVQVLLVNSAIVSINESPAQRDPNAKTVISYRKLLVD